MTVLEHFWADVRFVITFGRVAGCTFSIHSRLIDIVYIYSTSTSETGGHVRFEVMSCTCVRSLSERAKVLLLRRAREFSSSILDSSTLFLFLVTKEAKLVFCETDSFENLYSS